MQTEKNHIQSALEITEMLNFILNKAESGSESSKTSVNLNSELPIAGMKFSIQQISSLLKQALDNENSSSIISEEEYPSFKSGNASMERTVRSNTLASRIRPVPDEVRGRVRELVDMIENEEMAEENIETSNV